MRAVPQTCPDPEGFKDALQQYFTEIQQEAAWVDTNGAEAMSAVLELVRRHKVRAPDLAPRPSQCAPDLTHGPPHYVARCQACGGAAVEEQSPISILTAASVCNGPLRFSANYSFTCYSSIFLPSV